MKFSHLTRSFGPVLAILLLWTLPLAAQSKQTPTAQFSFAGGPGRDPELLKAAAAKPTPRLADGHPNLTGFWADPPVSLPYTRSADGKTVIVGEPEASRLDEIAAPIFKAGLADPSRRPQYKPEFQKKREELAKRGTVIDPATQCYPAGIPRIGAPTEIVQTPTTVYLMYGAEGYVENEDQVHTFRIIPIGGKHDPDRDPRPDGDSTAVWEGDTLVVDVVNIDTDTWVAGEGSFHDENLHVVERFTRKGDTLVYDVTVDDPTLFAEPWRPIKRGLGRIGSTTRIAREPGEHAIPDYACAEHDRVHRVEENRE